MWNSRNIEQLTGRPLLTGLFEDREAVSNQIRDLCNIAQTEPIHLVITHDAEQIEAYMQQGLLGQSFE